MYYYSSVLSKSATVYTKTTVYQYRCHQKARLLARARPKPCASGVPTDWCAPSPADHGRQDVGNTLTHMIGTGRGS